MYVDSRYSLCGVEGVLDGDAAVLSFEDSTAAASGTLYLSLALRLSANSSIGVTVQTPPPNPRTYRLVYAATDRILETAGSVIYYGIGPAGARRGWSTITRDLNVDLLKVHPIWLPRCEMYFCLRFKRYLYYSRLEDLCLPLFIFFFISP